MTTGERNSECVFEWIILMEKNYCICILSKESLGTISNALYTFQNSLQSSCLGLLSEALLPFLINLTHCVLTAIMDLRKFRNYRYPMLAVGAADKTVQDNDLPNKSCITSKRIY